ncbi:MAG: hypothetical protein U0324_28660 [Polyangiales bacterium]
MPTTLAGTLVGDRYKLLARVPDRGAGETWRAEDARRQGAAVSVKFLRAVDGAELPPAMLAAVRARKVFRHDAVPAVLAHGLHGGRPWVVFEELPGASAGALLDEARAQSRLVDLDLLRAAIASVADALRAAHAAPQPLFAGSIAPGAVVVPPKPVRGMGALLVDLGLHGHLDAPDDADPRSARLLVTDAPELLRGAPTARSDVFALGALCTELLALPPDVGDTVGRVSEARRRVDVPPAVWRALSTAMATDPAARFADVAALQRALDAAWEEPLSPLQRLLAPSPAPKGADSLLHSIVLPADDPAVAPPPLVPAHGGAARVFTPAPMPVSGPLPELAPDPPTVRRPPPAPTPAPTPAGPSALARMLNEQTPAARQPTAWDTHVLQGTPAPVEDDQATVVKPPPAAAEEDGNRTVLDPFRRADPVAAASSTAPIAALLDTIPPLPMNDPSGTLVATPASLRAPVGLPPPPLPPLPPPPRALTPPPVTPPAPPAPGASQALTAVAWAVGVVALAAFAVVAFLWARG